MDNHYIHRRTTRGGTDTREGMMPHCFHQGVLMPVKVQLNKRNPGQKPSVVTADGCLLFSLPGGGWYKSPYTPEEWKA